MPNLTPKQEAFVMAYVETGNASEAYRRAYNAENMKPETIHVKACELLKSGKVAARVAELQAEHRVRHRVTVDSILAELQVSRAMALDQDNPSAATQASMGKAKVAGLLEKKLKIESRNTVKIIDLTGASPL